MALKPGTDDLRESPHVELAERLLGKGRSLVFIDEHVHIARLTGGNRSYVEQHLPHLADLLASDQSSLDSSDLILICHRAEPFVIDRWNALGITVLDLTGTLSTSGGENLISIV